MERIGRMGMAGMLAVALFLTAAVMVRHGGTAAPAVAGSSAPPPAALLAPAAAGSLEGSIAALQQRLKLVPDDWRSYASLGLAYVQEARITFDPSYYPKAEGVLQRSLELHAQDNFEAMVGMAALAAARHDFAGALDWSRKARAVNPYNASVYGVMGDALVELGRYPQAFRTFQEMVDTRPDLSSYARVSYARELQGDVPGAIRAMSAAADYASSPADQAWAANQLGELYFNSGRLGRAEVQYRRATELAPTFVPPQAGLAKVAWARGDLRTAIEGYTTVTQTYPSPEYVIALGDLYEQTGREDLARQQFALVGTIQRLFTANGVNVDLELALFNADHGDPTLALSTARAEWDRRQAVNVADALGWALYADGRYREAAGYATKALALGTQNALFLFHAGMIQRALGDTGAARTFLREALATNPHFSIQYAPVARHALSTLGAAA